MEFDAIRGYRLTGNPRRMVCMGTNGELEVVATVRGNNEGFPDRDDFRPERGDQQHKRLAVFGDSFTAGLYLERSWPDVVEGRGPQEQAAAGADETSRSLPGGSSTGAACSPG